MADRLPVPRKSGLRGALARGVSDRRDLIRCGAEIVEVSERFYRGFFLGVMVFMGVASIAALVLFPLREPAGHGPSVVGVIGAGLLVIFTPLAVWRSASAYRMLRRHLWLEIAVVLYAAALVSAVLPLKSQLWWPACTLLMLVAVVAPVRRVLGYCLVALTLNLLAHVGAGDLDHIEPVSIIGLWVGFIFWSSTVALITDQLAAALLCLNADSAPATTPRRIVVASVAHGRPSQSEVVADAAADGHPTVDAPQTPVGRATAAAPLSSSDLATARLTVRQLQVAALLADGLRYGEIAACLSISEGQVQRHVARAVARMGVRTAAELVTLIVAEGIVPGVIPSARSDPGRRRGSSLPASPGSPAATADVLDDSTVPTTP